MKVIGAAFFLILLLVPFQWVVFFDALGLAAKPVHVALVAGVIAFAMYWRSATRLLTANRLFVLFTTAYGLSMLWSWTALLWTQDIATEVSAPSRNTIYFFFFIITSGLAAKLAVAGQLQRLAGTAAIAGVLSFTAYMVLLFKLRGYNVLTEYMTAIASANVPRLHHWFYPQLFNCDWSGVCVSGEDALVASLRNALIGSFIVYFVLLAWWRSAFTGSIWQVVISGMAFLAATLILLSVSRSNILSFVIVLAVHGFSRIAAHQSGSGPLRVLAPMAVFTVLTLFLWEGTGSIGEIIEARFGSLEDDARIEQYANAPAVISENIFLGSGIGTVISVGSQEFSTHNIFLSAWVETGLVGLVLALAWYLIACSAFFRTILGAIRTHGQNLSLPLWPATLPVLGLLRVQVSGTGTLTLIEWTALAIFFGALCGIQARERFGLAPVLGARRV